MVHSLGTSPVVLKSWNCSHSSSLHILWFRFSYSSYFMFSWTFSNSSHLSKSCTYEEYYFLFLSIGDGRLSPPLTMTNVGLMAYYIILQEKALPLVLMMCLL